MDIPSISNELEVNLHGVRAADMLAMNHLPLVGEVNPEHVVELNVSMAADVRELNERSRSLLAATALRAQMLGGVAYGGGALLEDVSGIEPKWYRTTSLSRNLARRFLDISSQQVVLGVQGRSEGIALFNYLRRASPYFLAISTASPRTFNTEPNGIQSRRMAGYLEGLEALPTPMAYSRDLRSLEDHQDALTEATTAVWNAYQTGSLDSNVEEMFRARDPAPYWPCERLAPHQVYWMVRLRPDHATSECDFSLEVRAPDMPASYEGVQMINNLIAGLAYRAADEGVDALPILSLTDERAAFLAAAESGPHGRIEGRSTALTLSELARAAGAGLSYRGLHDEATNLGASLDSVLTSGTEATRMAPHHLCSVNDTRSYLAGRMSEYR